MLDLPLVDECYFDLVVPAATGLSLRAWEFRLNRNPDPAKGQVTHVSIPQGVGEGYVAVVWDGEVDYRDASPGPGDCTNGDRIAGVTAGTVIELRDGIDFAHVAVLGLDTSNRQVGELPRGGHPFPDLGESSRQITFILRHFLLTPEFESIPLEDWPRPGFLLTTIDGPRIENANFLDSDVGGDLDFVLLPSNKWLTLRRGDGENETAFILDYHVVGDSAAPRDAQGCTYRCWGGGG